MPADLMPSAEDVDRQLEAEFMDEVRDTIGKIDILLGDIRSGRGDKGTGLADLKRMVLGMVSQGRGMSMPLINLTTHQLFDYLSGLSDLDRSQASDVQTYVDKLEDILEGKITSTEDAGAKLVRELPQKTGFDVDFGDIVTQDVQVLVIVPERAMARIIEREMAACGIRTTNVRDPFQAFELAIRIKPNMIIASREISGSLSGIDLACAFSSMPVTAQVPFALLSSYNWGHAALQGLPQRAALLKKGPTFGDDLAAAMERFDIF